MSLAKDLSGEPISLDALESFKSSCSSKSISTEQHSPHQSLEYCTTEQARRGQVGVHLPTELLARAKESVRGKVMYPDIAFADAFNMKSNYMH